MKKPLAMCANGCGVPPSPPSLVICRECQGKITKTLETMLARMERDAVRLAPTKKRAK